MKTHNLKAADINKKWVLVDANGQTLGRLASEIARVLRGKHKPTFTPHLDMGDHVVVINAEKIQVTGQKETDKFYYRHTGYIGGIKRASVQEVRARHPERILTYAVKGMLPKNKLSRKLMTHLKVYPGTEHPHEAQKPEPMAPRTKA